MNFSRVLWLGLTVAALVAATGCIPTGASSADEQKDPYYLSGKRRVNSLDFNGALEDFEKALEANPRSAAAHLELGILHEQKTKDYSAAIYHYDRFLKYKTDTEIAESIRQHIVACKQELARTVSLGPVNQMVQRDLERLDQLTKENAQLKAQIEQMQAQITQILALQMGRPGPNVPTAPVRAGTQPVNTGKHPAQASNTVVRAAVPQPIVGRTHVVQSGDTFYKIAKQYRVSEAALRTANPGVDARRMQLGQTLKIPSL